ncbi:MAG: hypothetical protein BACD_02596 [Bacteroides rodentium]
MLVISSASCAQSDDYVNPTKYDVRSKKSGLFPPYIPGTEDQMMARVQVMDISTMQPIAGAIVVGAYYGLVRGGMDCFASESAVTDENGYAWLPNDRDERVREGKNWRNGPRLVSAYKRGYQLIHKPYYSEYHYKDKAWYVYELAPPEQLLFSIDRSIKTGTPWSPTRLSGPYPDERSAFLASKERSTIFLYPSTATTKEERYKELAQIDKSCVRRFPFVFSNSEGGPLLLRAIYQEMLEIGYQEEDLPSYRELMKDNEEGLRRLQWQRKQALERKSNDGKK